MHTLSVRSNSGKIHDCCGQMEAVRDAAPSPSLVLPEFGNPSQCLDCHVFPSLNVCE